MFIDTTYFFGLISLPVNENIEDELNSYIELYEKKVLKNALGEVLYNQFINGLQEQTPLQKWVDLRDGANFNAIAPDGSTVLIHWNGLINTEKISLLAYNVYYEFIRSRNDYATLMGVVSPATENSNKSFINSKIRIAYNQFLDLYGSNELDLYEPSLFNFISSKNLENSTTYPNWIFKDLFAKYGYLNPLNI